MRNGRIEGVSFLIALALLFVGCRSRKETVRTTWERDSLTIQHNDSLWRSRQWQSATAATIRWEEVTLTPPDSSGRQYVNRLQRAVVEHTNQAEERDTLVRQTTGKYQQREKVIISEQEKKTADPFFRSPLVAILLLIAFLFFFIFILRKTIFNP